MTAMEETGTLQALSFLASARRVDLSRILVLRTGSNYTMPPSGMSAAESLTAMSLTQSPGYLPALEAAYADGQRVGIGLARTELETARGRLVASEVDDGDGTVDRLDAEAALGEEQRVPADATTEVEHVLRAARLRHRHHRRVWHEPVGAAFRRCPPLVPCLDRRRRHLCLRALPSAALAVIIGAKRRYARRKWSDPGTSALSRSGGRVVADQSPTALAVGGVAAIAAGSSARQQLARLDQSRRSSTNTCVRGGGRSEYYRHRLPGGECPRIHATTMRTLEFIVLPYALSGFGVGFVVGLTGVGGGSLMTPLLVLLFGFHPATAVGTDLLYASVTKTCGTAVHHIGQTVAWRVVLGSPRAAYQRAFLHCR